MAGSVNKVILVGRLGADPEVRQLNDGAVANLRIATSETWKDKRDGERKEKTEWHNVTVWPEGLVRVCEEYLHKGDQVYIEGKLETRKWQDQDGNDKYSTSIVLQGFNGVLTILQSKDGGNDRGRDDDRGDDRGSSRSSSSRRTRDSDDRNDDRGARSSRSSRSSDQGDDRGGRSSGNSRSNGRGRDDSGGDDGRSSRSNGQASSSRGGGGRRDMDDEIPF